MFRVALLTVLAAVFVSGVARAGDDKKPTIKEIMTKAHKGKDAPLQTVLAGKADEKILKEFLAYYEGMAAQKPPVGDEEGWKKRTAALVDATKNLIDKKPDALAALKTATDCKACHTAHKPPK